jgi:glucose/arabinose dehydrogenase
VAYPNNKWYGYPTCFTVGDPSEITDSKFQVGDQFVLAPNTTFSDTTCIQASTPPRLTFNAHNAPLDAKFNADFTSLFVTLHGSWDRQPASGYKLVIVPFTKGIDGAFAPMFMSNETGYMDILYPPNEGSCSSATCIRPVGLVFDAAGRLYMTSDTSGELFLIEEA